MGAKFNNLNHYPQTILRVSGNLTNLEKYCRQLNKNKVDEMRFCASPRSVFIS